MACPDLRATGGPGERLTKGPGIKGSGLCLEPQHRSKSGRFAVSDAESPPDFPAHRGPGPSDLLFWLSP